MQNNDTERRRKLLIIFAIMLAVNMIAYLIIGIVVLAPMMGAKAYAYTAAMCATAIVGVGLVCRKVFAKAPSAESKRAAAEIETEAEPDEV